MTTGLFSTEERKKMTLFSKPIWELPDGLLVKAVTVPPEEKQPAFGSFAFNRYDFEF